MCGDSTSAGAIATLMCGATADLVFTSPPYAQQRDYGAAKANVSDWDALMQGVFSVIPADRDTQVLVNLGLVHRDSEWLPYWDGWIEWMRSAGWRRFGFYVWDQGPGMPGNWNGRLAPAHEFIFHFNRAPRQPNKTKTKLAANIRDSRAVMRRKDGTLPKKAASPESGRQATKIPDTVFRVFDTVFRVMRHKARGIERGHPAVFPVALAEEAVEAFSAPGELLFEPFLGSGSQIIAAARTGRRCFGMEIDPAYVDVAVRRWQAFVGAEAVLEGDGRTFAEVSSGRAAA